MKKIIFYTSILFLLVFSGCKKESMITSKPGEPIGTITDLQNTVSDGSINLTWKLPATLPGDIVKPVSVLIAISIDGQNRGTVLLENAPENYIYTPYDSSKKYKFTIKVVGNVDTTDPYVSNLRYSLGQTITI